MFVQLLARARARSEPSVIQRRMEQAWRLRWLSIILVRLHELLRLPCWSCEVVRVPTARCHRPTRWNVTTTMQGCVIDAGSVSDFFPTCDAFQQSLVKKKHKQTQHKHTKHKQTQTQTHKSQTHKSQTHKTQKHKHKHTKHKHTQAHTQHTTHNTQPHTTHNTRESFRMSWPWKTRSRWWKNELHEASEELTKAGVSCYIPRHNCMLHCTRSIVSKTKSCYKAG